MALADLDELRDARQRFMDKARIARLDDRPKAIRAYAKRARVAHRLVMLGVRNRR